MTEEIRSYLNNNKMKTFWGDISTISEEKFLFLTATSYIIIIIGNI